MNLADAFPEIMKRGGFDAIVGNPPYVRIQGSSSELIAYLSQRYVAARKNFDLYVPFLERGYSLLNKKGRVGMILPNKFFKTDYGENLRGFLSKQKSISQIVDFGASQVFAATTYTCLLFLSKEHQDTFDYIQTEASTVALNDLQFEIRKSEFLSNNTWMFGSEEVATIERKLEYNSKRLLDLPSEMSRGSSSGDDEVFVLGKGKSQVEKEILRVPIFATDFGRFHFLPSREWEIIFPYVSDGGKYRLYTEKELKGSFPKAYSYLREHQSKLQKRKQYSEWFGYSAPRNLDLHDKAQILVPLLADKGSFAFIPKTTQGKLCPMASGGFTITLDKNSSLAPEYVLGLLNSHLLFWKLKRMSNLFRGGWITCTKQYFGELPIDTINFTDPADKSRHDNIVKLVEQMLAAKERLAQSKTDSETHRLEAHCASLDRQIDAAVYELYGLTEEEIKIVEGKEKS